MIGNHRRPENFRRVRNLRGLTIAGFLAFVVVVAGAALYFERHRWFGSESYDIVAGISSLLPPASGPSQPSDLTRPKNPGPFGTPRQTSEPAAGSLASEVFEEQSSNEASRIREPPAPGRPSPSANEERLDSTAYGQTLAAQEGARIDTRVYVHMLHARDRFVLEDVSDALRHRGYIIPYTRVATGRTEGDVRFFFPQDRREAERVKSLIESELGSRGYYISLELLERDGKKFQLAAPGNIEVWLPPLPNSG